MLLCALMCLSSVNIIYVLISLFAYASNTNYFIYMYYNVLPNKLTIEIKLTICIHEYTKNKVAPNSGNTVQWHSF